VPQTNGSAAVPQTNGSAAVPQTNGSAAVPQTNGAGTRLEESVSPVAGRRFKRD
jgi:hypothetical protein